MSSNSSAPENSIPQNYREKFQGREIVTKWADPCDHASKASMDCLNRNDYDRDKCTDFFRAYRECKAAWVSWSNVEKIDVQVALLHNNYHKEQTGKTDQFKSMDLIDQRCYEQIEGLD